MSSFFQIILQKQESHLTEFLIFLEKFYWGKIQTPSHSINDGIKLLKGSK